MKSDNNILNDLHDALAKRLLQMVQNGEEIPAGVLKEAREFLKDNGINCDGPSNPSLKQLGAGLGGLPFASEDDESEAGRTVNFG